MRQVLPPWSTPASRALDVRNEGVRGDRVVLKLGLNAESADISGRSIDPAAALFLADHCMGMVLRAGHGWEIPVLTVEMRVDWAFAYEKVEELECEGELVNTSGRCALLRARLVTSDGRLFATSSGQFLLGAFVGGATEATANTSLEAPCIKASAGSFREFLGLRSVDDPTSGNSTVMDPAEHLIGVVEPQVYHGGIVASALGAICDMHLEHESAARRRLGCTVQFLRPALGGQRLFFSANPLLLGQTISVVSANVFSEGDLSRPLAHATASFVTTDAVS